MSNANTAAVSQSTFKAHPAGLSTLFFTEMWERFSYYGMRALLILFMTAAIQDGGLGFNDATAAAIYGLYTASVYLVALPGGWIADRLIGAQRSVFYGGVIIMCGHFVLAIPALTTFYLGLVLVVLGTGLLKPNISTIVGEMYDKADANRDAGYTIFYMGINVGAMLGPLVCSTLGESETFGWHYGFASAGVGMLFGLIQYRMSQAKLEKAGYYPAHLRGDTNVTAPPAHGWLFVGIGVGALAFIFILMAAGVVTMDPVVIATGATYFISFIAALFFMFVLLFGKLDYAEKKRVGVIIILVISAAIFWAGFEQAGSSLNLFAERYTDRVFFGYETPTGWAQSLNPLFILIFAPFFAALWVNLGKRNLNPSIPFKFALGLVQVGLGFLVMVFAAKIVITGEKVLPTWLILTYLLHTTGELCLSPVGLSAISKLAPKKYVSQMMGVWFIGTALGNLIAGLAAGRFDPEVVQQMPNLFMEIVIITVGTGIILILFLKPIRKMMGDVQ